MSFHANVSDPAYGGTYLTILAAASNFGKTWPGSVSLLVSDWMKMDSNATVSNGNTTSSTELYWNEYNTLSMITSSLGFMWLVVCYRTIMSYRV